MVVKHRTVDGKRYYVVREGLTKAEAIRSANWQRKGKFSARIYKMKAKECPNCKSEETVTKEENLLGQKVYVLKCKKCLSYSTSHDNIHFQVTILVNNK